MASANVVKCVVRERAQVWLRVMSDHARGSSRRLCHSGAQFARAVVGSEPRAFWTTCGSQAPTATVRGCSSCMHMHAGGWRRFSSAAMDTDEEWAALQAELDAADADVLPLLSTAERAALERQIAEGSDTDTDMDDGQVRDERVAPSTARMTEVPRPAREATPFLSKWLFRRLRDLPRPLVDSMHAVGLERATELQAQVRGSNRS